jgi:alpha-L-fucosidase 2
MKITNRIQKTARSSQPKRSKRFGFRILLLITFALSASLGAADRFAASAANGNPGTLIWDSPSKDSKGSMPIGNGDIGLNVWVEPSGDLVFFIGKTDAWDENMRLLKLGKIRVKLTPALAVTNGFRQELNLRDGVLEIQNQQVNITVWVDANNPVIAVDAKSLTGQALQARASFESWRKEKRPLGSPASGGNNEYFSTGYTSVPAFSYPDRVLPATAQRIGWYHHNVDSPWLPSLKLQKVEAIAQTEQDPILHRTTGAIVQGENLVSVSDTELKTAKPARELALRIHVLTQITAAPQQWIAALEKQAATIETIPAAQRRQQHTRWWNEFWNRSWISVTGDSDAATVTRGYALQRWINACGGRGAFPIKFNGSIFVVDNRFDADYRAWGGGYWFQNTRLPYWSMLAAGDFDLMRPLFEMYLKAIPARKLATRNYYGHDGAFFPETMSFWGNYLDQGDLGYGTNRTGKPDGLTDNEYIRRYWQGGLELVALMLDYFDMTQDAKFRDTTLLPFATEIVAFFDQHWKRGPDGKILFHPSQSLETWWDCTNPTPEIAGLRYVIPRLQQLTRNATLRTDWQKTLNDLPSVPLGTDNETGKKFLLPAERFASKHNCENTELYAVFPYRLYTLAAGSNALDIARSTWPRRRDPENGGWQQNAIQAALLGLAGEARNYVVDSASRHAVDFRFPAMWGPNYDWTPDQDHGSVMLSALQRMLLQYEGKKILLLPAWPREWSCSFKLHAPFNTVIQGVVKDGKLVDLKVTPENRRKDIVVGSRTGWETGDSWPR